MWHLNCAWRKGTAHSVKPPGPRVFGVFWIVVDWVFEDGVQLVILLPATAPSSWRCRKSPRLRRVCRWQRGKC